MEILSYLLKFGMFLVWLMALPYQIFIRLKRPKYCPPIQDKTLKMPAIELAEKIRKRQLSSEYLVKAYINRIQEVNPVLNAIVKDRFKEAICEAQDVDKLLSSKTHSEEELKANKPFLGVPFTVKESIPVLGMPNRAGSQMYKDRSESERDAETVLKMKNAGGIPLLVSNTPELCMNWETNNKVTGRTNNPYDTRKTCGGSSGGEAALLGSGASVLSLGSDVGGSLRIPAHFCGVFGHKPTPTIVNYKDHFPNCKSDELWPWIFTVGPMTRYATDLPLFLHTICTDESRPKLNLLEKPDIKSIKVFYIENDGGHLLTSNVDPEITQKMRTFITYLKTTHNIEAKPLNIPGMKQNLSAILTLLQMDEVDSCTPNKNVKLEYFKYFLGLSKACFIPLLYAFWQPIIKSCTPKRLLVSAHNKLDVIKSTILNNLGDDGVLLYPCFPNAAHYHNEIFYKVFDVSYLCLFNSFGLPATSCTLGLKSNGLPVGMQVVTSTYNDRLALRVAEEIEVALGGWQPPPFQSSKLKDVKV